MQYPLFVLSREDWSLHRKGQRDQERHQEKVKEAIKDHLAEIVSEEAIIMSDGREKIKVPIRSIQQYKFRYSYNNQEQVGQGAGDSQVGDILGQGQGQPAGPGQGQQAGDQPGEDYYEAEISIDELAEIIFEDLQLPNLKNKQKQEMTNTEVQFNNLRKKGIMGNIDKRRTILESMKRQARSLSPMAGLHIADEDLRFKTWDEIEKPTTNAVILAMMDTSGSMGSFEKYIARSFYFWMVRFLRTCYQNVDIRFLAHDTQAKEVSEEHFFTKGESGGTMCSSVYKLALQLIEESYPPDHYNIYAFHFSDGDNYSSDNQQTVQFVNELLEKCNRVGYGEINRYSRSTTLMAAMNQINHPHFVYHVMKQETDVYQALQAFFQEQWEALQ
ncbi:sporulation protein YhbH [Caldalkalibacillus mannanilyticus]|uniref:sporulation protein YhbH n=1 Tax=Caldalkalibacillus mannanilyticus TaxID=1418 RepID=UPI00054FD744|nr:sporulation protein YhbH [Caldalkalibacillus mannanilyticus]